MDVETDIWITRPMIKDSSIPGTPMNVVRGGTYAACASNDPQPPLCTAIRILGVAMDGDFLSSKYLACDQV